jgi:hypothetical protein
MSSRELGDKHAEIVIEDLVGATPGWWAYHRGAILGVLEAAGTKKTLITIKEGGGTSERTLFAITWS